MDVVYLLDWVAHPDFVILTYSDGDSFFVSRSDFDRAFGPILSGSKDQIRRDFEIHL